MIILKNKWKIIDRNIGFTPSQKESHQRHIFQYIQQLILYLPLNMYFAARSLQAAHN